MARNSNTGLRSLNVDLDDRLFLFLLQSQACLFHHILWRYFGKASTGWSEKTPRDGWKPYSFLLLQDLLNSKGSNKRWRP